MCKSQDEVRLSKTGQKEPWLKQELWESRSRTKVVKAKGRESDGLNIEC